MPPWTWLDSHTDRILDTTRILEALAPRQRRSWRILDIGGFDFAEAAERHGWVYESIDLAEAQQHGTGGHRGGFTTHTYNGRDLPFRKGAFDVVILSFMLHHAGENTLRLLQQVHHVAKSFVLVGEDLTGLEYPLGWHQRNYDHQPGGMYRSDEEWRRLFALLEWDIVKAYAIRNKKYLFWEPSDKEYSQKIYRALYLLKPT